MKQMIIKLMITCSLVVVVTTALRAQKDDYVEQQLHEMTVADSLDMSIPLDTYLKIAAENNPRLKSLFNQYLAALERVPQVRTLPDPSVMFSIFTSPVETRVGATRAGISLNQAFPWFGQLRAQGEAATDLAKARFEQLDNMRNKLFYDVRTTYYNLYVLEVAIRINRENIELLESLRQLANVRLESGKGSAVDLLRVEMDLAELDNELKFLEDSRVPIAATFHELLNTDTVQIVLPDTLSLYQTDADKSVLIDSMMVNNPDLRRLDAEISALVSESTAARKMGLPSFNIGLAYTNVAKRDDVPDFSGNGKDSFIFPQVGVRVPLYRNKYKSMVQEKNLLQTARVEEKEDTQNRLIKQLENVWRDKLDAERRISLNLYLADLAQKSLDLLLADYTAAGADFEEVLRMERKLLKYELALEKARADQSTSAAFIDYLTAK